MVQAVKTKGGDVPRLSFVHQLCRLTSVAHLVEVDRWVPRQPCNPRRRNTPARQYPTLLANLLPRVELPRVGFRCLASELVAQVQPLGRVHDLVHSLFCPVLTKIYV